MTTCYTYTLQTTTWVHQIRNGTLYLYYIDNNNKYVAPNTSVTDGIKLEYMTGDRVFVDSEGFSVDNDPDEDSYINANDAVVLAVIEFVKAKLAEDDGNFQLSEFLIGKFREKLGRAEGAMRTGIRVAIPITPYAIR